MLLKFKTVDGFTVKTNSSIYVICVGNKGFFVPIQTLGYAVSAHISCYKNYQECKDVCDTINKLKKQNKQPK